MQMCLYVIMNPGCIYKLMLQYITCNSWEFRVSGTVLFAVITVRMEHLGSDQESYTYFVGYIWSSGLVHMYSAFCLLQSYVAYSFKEQN
jgi:hypothetical protein